MIFRIVACLTLITVSILSEHSMQWIHGKPLLFQAPAKKISSRGSTIRVETSLVLVPVSVTDANGRAVKNLVLKDFFVLENGSAVKLEPLREPESTQLEIVLVFDVTGSTRPRFDFVRQAAAGFLKSLFREGDAVSILCIASDPEVLLERTESLMTALDGLDRLKPFGAATAFFDSIIRATRLFKGATDPETRRVMVVLSDGEDNFSAMKLQDALRRVQRVDCVFYTINPEGPSIRRNRISLRGQKWMETIARQTGGSAFFAENLQDLSNIYSRIAAELKAQYLLSYYSPDSGTEGQFRSITVTVPDHPELRVRARQGYYAE